MNKIDIFRNLAGDIVKVELDGHTGYAESGSDIVCAAVSAVVFSTFNGVEKVVGIDIGYEQADGYLLVVLPESIKTEKRKNINILLESMVLFLKDLATQYPDNIQIAELEV